MTVVPLNPDAHEAVQVLLPWYASDRLDPDERAEVQAHLAVCTRCQAALEAERRLMAAHREMDTSGDVERGMAALRARLSQPPRTRPFAWRRPFAAAAGGRWLAGLALAQAAVIALLAGLLLWPGTEVDYRLLGNAGPGPGGNVVVKFHAQATEADVRRALRSCGARIADGPTASDAWLLSVPAGQEVSAVQRLRDDRAVVLAESLAPGAGR
jgi:hypothetical protein